MRTFTEGINFDSINKVLASTLIKHKHVYYNADCLGIKETSKVLINKFLVRFVLCDYLTVVVIDDVFVNDGRTNFKLYSN